MKNKRMRVLTLLMVFVMLIGMVQINAANYEVNTSGADDPTALPTSLAMGQIWTDKSVELVDGTTDTFDITLSALGKNYESTQTNTPDNVDVVYILDYSVSMNENNKLSNMKKAARDSANRLLNRNGQPTGNRVAMVYFSGTARIGQEFTASYDAFSNSLNRIADGGTNIQDGIRKAQNLIENRTDETRKPIFILLSDGAPTYYYDGVESTDRQGTGGSYGGKHVWNTILQAQHAKNQIAELKFYTIGFGVGNNAYAIATLMPTAGNTLSYRPHSYQENTTTETAKAKYERQYIYWWTYEYILMTPLRLRDREEIETTLGNVFVGWQQPSGEATFQKTGNTQYYFQHDFWGNHTCYYEGIYTETKYLDQGVIPFNHQYYEPESSITSNGLQEITDIFANITTEILQKKPHNSDVVITDKIGSAFDLVIPLPSGVSYDSTTGVVTWTIKKDNFVTRNSNDDTIARDNSVTFQVKFNPNNISASGTYYTNVEAKSSVTVTENNPFYLENQDKTIITELKNNGWVEIKDSMVEAKITIQKTVSGLTDNTQEHTWNFQLLDSNSQDANVLETYSVNSVGNGTFSKELSYNVLASQFDGQGQAKLYMKEVAPTPAAEGWTYDALVKEIVIDQNSTDPVTVSFTNSYEPKGSLTVSKEWVGNGPKDDVSFHLWHQVNGNFVKYNENAYTINLEDGASVPLTIENLPLGTYKVVEAPIDDYTTTYSDSGNGVVIDRSNLNQRITIINAYVTPTSKITVTKVWEDSNNAAYRKDVTVNIALPGSGTDSIILTANGNWTATYESNLFGEFTFTEAPIADYTLTTPNSVNVTTSMDNREASVSFTNQYVQPTGSLTITKVWSNDNTDVRPESITVQVLKDEEAYGNAITLDAQNKWKSVVANLPILDGQDTIYSVQELDVENYSTTYSEPVQLNFENRQGSITITNTYDKKGTVTIRKNWVTDSNLPAVPQPESVTVKLLDSDNQVAGTVTLNATNSWEARIENLALGTYTVEEVSVNNYKTTYSYGNSANDIQLVPGNEESTVTVTNTYAKGTITVGKVWANEANNPEAERPESVTLKLYKKAGTGKKAEAAVEIPEIEVPEGQPVDETPADETPADEQATDETPADETPADEQPADETPAEEQPADETPADEQPADEQPADETPADEQPTDETPAEETGDIGRISHDLALATSGDNEAAEARADELIATITLQRGQTHTFYDLELGATYYIVEEEVPEYYTVTLPDPITLTEENSNATIKVTNTYNDPKGTITVTKEWIYGYQPTSNRVTSFTITLYKGDTKIGSQTSTGSMITFDNLDLYARYRIVETAISGYQAKYSTEAVELTKTNRTNSFNVTNSYVPETGSVELIKTWSAGNPLDEVTMYINRYQWDGQQYVIDNSFEQIIKTLKATDDVSTNWKAVVAGLEVNGPNNAKYQYRVTESASNISLYDVTLPDPITLTAGQTAMATVDNAYNPNKGSLTVTKVWEPVLAGGYQPPVESIEFRLIEVDPTNEQEKPETNTRTLSKSNSWTANISQLDATKQYRVEEVTTIDGYTKSYSEQPINLILNNDGQYQGNITITNKQTPITNLTLEKTLLNPSITGEGEVGFNYQIKVKNTGNTRIVIGEIKDLLTFPAGASVSSTITDATTTIDENVLTTWLYQQIPTEVRILNPEEEISYDYEIKTATHGNYDNTVTVTYKEVNADEMSSVSASASGIYKKPQPTEPETRPTPDPTPTVKTGNVNVNYVDVDGVVLAAQESMAGDVGTSYTTTAKSFADYELTATPSNANGNFIDGTITVIYIYQPIDIEEEPIPEDTPVETSTDVPEDVIVDDPIPQGDLPKTGGIPLEVFGILGSGLIGAGTILIRKKRK